MKEENKKKIRKDSINISPFYVPMELFYHTFIKTTSNSNSRASHGAKVKHSYTKQKG